MGFAVGKAFCGVVDAWRKGLIARHDFFEGVREREGSHNVGALLEHGSQLLVGGPKVFENRPDIISGRILPVPRLNASIIIKKTSV